MKLINGSQENTIIEKKSKFITRIFYADNENEIKEIIENIRKNEKGAVHKTYAYRVLVDERIVERKNDDGEPGGTAGSPMLAVLSGRDIINVLAVTTRYFGGIKLGTGGLVNVYKKGVKEVIKKCILTDYQKTFVCKLIFSLNKADFVERTVKRSGIIVNEKIFGINAEFILTITESQQIVLKELLSSVRCQLIKL